jgi:biotin operon repressor
MAKTKQFERVLKVLLDASPNTVTKTDLANQLGGEIVMSRISTYIWEIKEKAGVPVEAEKNGREVTGFSINEVVKGIVEETTPVETVSVPESDSSSVTEMVEESDVATA